MHIHVYMYIAVYTYISISAAREAATVPFQVQVDLGPLDVCVVVCVLQESMQTCSEHFGASDGSGFQFGSLGAVFCMFWSPEKHAKIIPKC